MTIRCHKHPQYEAKRRVRSGCLKCQLIYWLVNKGLINPPVSRRRKAKKVKIDRPPLPGVEVITPADQAAIERFQGEGGRQ